MDATVRQRTLRALALLSIGILAILLVSLDPARALRSPAFLLMLAGMAGWTIAENLVLQQDEPSSYRGKRGTRIMQACVIGTLLVASAEHFHLPPLLPRGTATMVAGFALLVAGASVRIAAIRSLARHFRYELRVADGQRLVDTGLYARIRHPSYLGLILITVGAALVFSSVLGVLAALALLGGATFVRIREEERVLREAFGQAYADYSARTWRLVPYVC